MKIKQHATKERQDQTINKRRKADSCQGRGWRIEQKLKKEEKKSWAGTTMW